MPLKVIVGLTEELKGNGHGTKPARRTHHAEELSNPLLEFTGLADQGAFELHLDVHAGAAGAVIAL